MVVRLKNPADVLGERQQQQSRYRYEPQQEPLSSSSARNSARLSRRAIDLLAPVGAVEGVPQEKYRQCGEVGAIGLERSAQSRGADTGESNNDR